MITKQLTPLEKALRANLYHNYDVEVYLGRCVQYVSHRINGKKDWTRHEMYQLCDMVGHPRDRVHELFPPFPSYEKKRKKGGTAKCKTGSRSK